MGSETMLPPARPGAVRRGWIGPLALVLLAAGLAVVAHGASGVPLADAWPWSPDGFPRYVATLAAISVIVALPLLLRRGAPAAVAAGIAVLAVASAGLLGALLVVVALALASCLVGARLRRMWGDGADEPLLDVLVGAGAFGTVVSLLAHVPAVHGVVCVLLIALPILASPGEARRVLVRAGLALRTSPRTPGAWLLATLATLYVVVALFPEAGWDALAMHLFIPEHVAVHGRWTFDAAQYSWALWPTLVDFVYALALVPGGETAARLVNVAALLALAGASARLAIRCGAAVPHALAGAALLLSTPLAFAVGTSLFVDAGWAAWIVGGVLALAAGHARASAPAGWVTAAVLFGFAAAAKAVTLPMLPALAAAVLLQAWTLRPERALRAFLLAAAGFLVAGSKPYLVSWLVAGNPVYPFYVHVLGGAPFEFWTSGPQHYAWPPSWRTVYDATFRSTMFIEGRPGAPGVQWLLLLPAGLAVLLAARARVGLALAVLAAALVLSVASFTTYLRYLVPGLVVLHATLPVALTALSRHARVAAAAFTGTAAFALVVNLVFINAAGTHTTFPVNAALGAAEREAAMVETAPVRVAGAFAARHPASGRALAFFAASAFAAAPGKRGLHPGWYTPAFYRDVLGARTPDEFARILMAWETPVVVVDPGWSGNAPWRALLEAATQPVAEWRGAAVREVRAQYAYRDELVPQPRFATRDGWMLAPGASWRAEGSGVVVTVAGPAWSVVPVVPGTQFVNQVRARCAAGQQYRLQVNWLDADQAFLGTALQSLPCTGQWEEPSQRIVAPPRAAFAVVYASGADAHPVEFAAVSLRGRR